MSAVQRNQPEPPLLGPGTLHSARGAPGRWALARPQRVVRLGRWTAVGGGLGLLSWLYHAVSLCWPSYQALFLLLLGFLLLAPLLWPRRWLPLRIKQHKIGR